MCISHIPSKTLCFYPTSLPTNPPTPNSPPLIPPNRIIRIQPRNPTLRPPPLLLRHHHPPLLHDPHPAACPQPPSARPQHRHRALQTPDPAARLDLHAARRALAQHVARGAHEQDVRLRSAAAREAGRGFHEVEARGGCEVGCGEDLGGGQRGGFEDQLEERRGRAERAEGGELGEDGGVVGELGGVGRRSGVTVIRRDGVRAVGRRDGGVRRRA